MDNLLDDVMIQVRRCENATQTLDAEPFRSDISKLLSAANSIGKASSGSWIGYHSRVYYEDFLPPPPGCWFDAAWGLRGRWEQTVGDWREWSYEEVVGEILERAGNPDLDRLDRAAREVGVVFDDCQMNMVAVLDAALAGQDDARLSDLRDKIAKLESHLRADDIARVQGPKRIETRDNVAFAQGVNAPPHVAMQAQVLSFKSYQAQIQELAKLGRQTGLYLEKRLKMKGASVAKKEGKVFIGHGRSSAWRDLKDLLQDRLRLTPDEFNLSPAAGLATKERLEQMLDEASFAFLVMTAEDEHADTTKHARENVVHEAGLFQGRLGFRRAIVLLEEGCAEFSNIEGLGQIRFPKGNIKAKSEDIRAVLEREGLL